MKPLLASKLINALSNPKRGLSGYMGGSIADEMANKTQIEIVQSQKFVISPSLVNHAVRASFSKPSVLLDMLNQGKPPYNNLWLEWDEDYRQDCLQTVHKENGKDFSEVKTNPNKVTNNKTNNSFELNKGAIIKIRLSILIIIKL